MGAISGAVFAQSGANLPLQRGVSVQLAVTTNAVAVPNADRQDALVVALTADGTTYLHADRVPMPDLANRVRSTLSTQKDKTLYIKADARVPYARLVEVMDAVQKSGVQGLTFLTAQQDAADQREEARVAERSGTAGSLTNRARDLEFSPSTQRPDRLRVHIRVHIGRWGSKKDWRRRPDLNRGWRFCSFPTPSISGVISRVC